jgi:hypothetical protein
LLILAFNIKALKMKRILGLDLGTNSIGWALTNQNFDKKQGEIIGLGSRIIPISQDVMGKFDSGVSISPTTETIAASTLKKLDAEPILVAAPPKILSVLPKGVSIASKATVPTIKSLFIKLSLRDFEAISN